LPLARTDVDRDEKVKEILAVAERRVAAGGFDEMSIAAIARELGIAQNSVYWYFPSKDELFVAVLRRQLERLGRRKPPRTKGLLAQILWATDQMHDLAPRRAELRARAAFSEAAAGFAREVDDLVRRLLVHGIEPLVAADRLDLVATTFLATVEGTFALGLRRAERHAVIAHAAEHLLGIQAS
jgi:AcrR family transcriptional regulator